MSNTTSSGTTYGNHGRFLHVDLTAQTGRLVPIEEAVLRRFLGGSGLGTYLMLQQQAARAEPLQPEAAIAFVFSPLVGSPLTTSAKFAVVSKSPLTGRINDAMASSGFAIAGKKCGCDAIVITGRAAEPTVLIVDDGQVRFEPAGDLWGMNCDEAQHRLHERLGGDYQAAVIGPAGERQVRYATISHDGRHAGRGGSGAVLGAKNLKALAVRGRQRCRFAEPEELLKLAKTISQKSLGPATAKYRELGTAANLIVFNRMKALPTRNFQQASLADAANLSVETLTATRKKTRAHCAACTIGCEHIYSLEDRDGGTSGGVRLEYENLFALGPLCGISDPDVVLRASKLCDQLGLDTISAGGTIAFAMECVERGLLDAPWLSFGDGGALIEAIEQIGRREGLGNRLAEGSRRLAHQIGAGSIDFAPQVKGLELPGYEPRALQTMALGFAVNSRGADHNRSGAYAVDFSDKVDRRHGTPAAATLAIETEDQAALLDSLILCKFLRGVFDDIYAEAAHMLNLVTGWDVTADELHRTARRIVTAKKLFNIRAGWRPEEDTLAKRFLSQTPSDDPSARLPGDRLAAMVQAYNTHRGWTAQGWIGEDHLQQLDLADV